MSATTCTVTAAGDGQLESSSSVILAAAKGAGSGEASAASPAEEEEEEDYSERGGAASARNDDDESSPRRSAEESSSSGRAEYEYCRGDGDDDDDAGGGTSAPPRRRRSARGPLHPPAGERCLAAGDGDGSFDNSDRRAASSGGGSASEEGEGGGQGPSAPRFRRSSTTARGGDDASAAASASHVGTLSWIEERRGDRRPPAPLAAAASSSSIGFLRPPRVLRRRSWSGGYGYEPACGGGGYGGYGPPPAFQIVDDLDLALLRDMAGSGDYGYGYGYGYASGAEDYCGGGKKAPPPFPSLRSVAKFPSLRTIASSSSSSSCRSTAAARASFVHPLHVPKDGGTEHVLAGPATAHPSTRRARRMAQRRWTSAPGDVVAGVDYSGFGGGWTGIMAAEQQQDPPTIGARRSLGLGLPSAAARRHSDDRSEMSSVTSCGGGSTNAAGGGVGRSSSLMLRLLSSHTKAAPVPEEVDDNEDDEEDDDDDDDRRLSSSSPSYDSDDRDSLDSDDEEYGLVAAARHREDEAHRAILEEARELVEKVNRSLEGMGRPSPFRPALEIIPRMEDLHRNLGRQLGSMCAAGIAPWPPPHDSGTAAEVGGTIEEPAADDDTCNNSGDCSNNGPFGIGAGIASPDVIRQAGDGPTCEGERNYPSAIYDGDDRHGEGEGSARPDNNSIEESAPSLTELGSNEDDSMDEMYGSSDDDDAPPASRDVRGSACELLDRAQHHFNEEQHPRRQEDRLVKQGLTRKKDNDEHGPGPTTREHDGLRHVARKEAAPNEVSEANASEGVGQNVASCINKKNDLASIPDALKGPPSADANDEDEEASLDIARDSEPMSSVPPLKDWREVAEFLAKQLKEVQKQQEEAGGSPLAALKAIDPLDIRPICCPHDSSSFDNDSYSILQKSMSRLIDDACVLDPEAPSTGEEQLAGADRTAILVSSDDPFSLFLPNYMYYRSSDLREGGHGTYLVPTCLCHGTGTHAGLRYIDPEMMAVFATFGSYLIGAFATFGCADSTSCSTQALDRMLDFDEDDDDEDDEHDSTRGNIVDCTDMESHTSVAGPRGAAVGRERAGASSRVVQEVPAGGFLGLGFLYSKAVENFWQPGRTAPPFKSAREEDESLAPTADSSMGLVKSPVTHACSEALNLLGGEQPLRTERKVGGALQSESCRGNIEGRDSLTVPTDTNNDQLGVGGNEERASRGEFFVSGTKQPGQKTLREVLGLE